MPTPIPPEQGTWLYDGETHERIAWVHYFASEKTARQFAADTYGDAATVNSAITYGGTEWCVRAPVSMAPSRVTSRRGRALLEGRP